MSEAYLTNWSFGGEIPDARNHAHEIALREARIASEYRQVEPASPAKESFLRRLRLAFARPAAAEACTCPA
jgi:hypothetical protein